jgi:hypothetical protein
VHEYILIVVRFGIPLIVAEIIRIAFLGRVDVGEIMKIKSFTGQCDGVYGF